MNPALGRQGPAAGREPYDPALRPAWLQAFVERYGRRAGDLWVDLSEDGRTALERLLVVEGVIDRE